MSITSEVGDLSFYNGQSQLKTKKKIFPKDCAFGLLIEMASART